MFFKNFPKFYNKNFFLENFTAPKIVLTAANQHYNFTFWETSSSKRCSQIFLSATTDT